MKFIALTITTLCLTGFVCSANANTLKPVQTSTPRREQPKLLGKSKKADTGIVLTNKNSEPPTPHRGSGRK